MTSLTDTLRKHLTLLVIAILLMSCIIPVISSRRAGAYNLITNRFIEMSSSVNAATPVTYKVHWRAQTTFTLKGIVVDFCSNSPIIGDSCTIPASFDVGGGGTPAVTLVTGLTPTWTAASANSGRTLLLTNATGDSMTANTTDVEFDITTVTNPATTNTTFYARILAYANDSGADSPATYTAGSPGAASDAGGIALSTAQQITITSKVQERLVFCVYTGVNCAAGGSAVALGDTNGVLDPAGPYVDKNTQFDIATNASQGVAIRIKGDTLKSGSFDVAAIGGTAAASNPANEQFGFCSYQTAGSGLTPAAPYDDSNCNTTTQSAGTGTPGGAGTAQFAFNTANTNTTYGDVFANKTAGSTSSGVLAFIGNISNTTEAGIYSTTLIFVATGTY